MKRTPLIIQKEELTEHQINSSRNFIIHFIPNIIDFRFILFSDWQIHLKINKQTDKREHIYNVMRHLKIYVKGLKAVQALTKYVPIYTNRSGNIWKYLYTEKGWTLYKKKEYMLGTWFPWHSKIISWRLDFFQELNNLLLSRSMKSLTLLCFCLNENRLISKLLLFSIYN